MKSVGRASASDPRRARTRPDNGDRRSFRVALVADRYLNPPARGLDAIPILLQADWGVIQLPADDYPEEVAAPLLAQVAEHTEEFHRHGYDVVVIGRRDGLEEALAIVGLPRFDQVDPANAGALDAFLGRRPAPQASSSRRREARSRSSATVKKA